MSNKFVPRSWDYGVSTITDSDNADAEMKAQGYMFCKDTHLRNCEGDVICYIRVYEKREPTVKEEVQEALEYLDVLCADYGRTFPASLGSARAILRRIIAREEIRHDRSKG